MHPYVHSSTIHSGRDVEMTKVSFQRGLNKEDVVHVFNEYYSAPRKGEILTFETTWMDLENIMLSKISQSGKAKNNRISLICEI